MLDLRFLNQYFVDNILNEPKLISLRKNSSIAVDY